MKEYEIQAKAFRDTGHFSALRHTMADKDEAIQYYEHLLATGACFAYKLVEVSRKDLRTGVTGHG